ncbi:MAG: toll/interleukin-1 receptor domain-containing protein [Chitinophagaceae bacterium]|nr:toll/interleukin-1 receptor domain-containing protein [Chitinophagaceae bacterium]
MLQEQIYIFTENKKSMPGLFISHSSVDKPFVMRLAVDLLNQNFPVWLDTLEIEAGDSLMDKINKGIDDSFFQLVILSGNSMKSPWVKRELELAMEKQKALGRKFILPVLYTDSEIPDVLKHVLYIDFRNDYLQSLEKLTGVLMNWGVDKLDIPPERKLIPLKFYNQLDLDRWTFTNRVQTILNHHPKHQFVTDQLLIVDDNKYTVARNKLLHRLENVERDKYYSADLVESLREGYANVKQMENKLKVLTVELVNHWTEGLFDYGEAAYWSCKKLRGKCLEVFWYYQNPNDPLLDFTKEERLAWDACSWISPDKIESFYNAGKLRQIGVRWRVAPYSSFTIYIPDHHPVFAFWEGGYFTEEPLNAWLGFDDLSRFLIPQMQALEESRWTWDFDNCVIGPA